LKYAARVFAFILCTLIVVGCASKPATKATETQTAVETTPPKAEAAKPEAEAAPQEAAPQEAESRTAVVSDMTEPPPPPPTLVLAPDEPALPEVARAPETPPKKVEAAPQPAVAAKETPPAVKETPKPAAKPKEPVKPKAAPPAVKPAEEKPSPPPARETVPVPSVGLGELPTRAAPEVAEDTVSYSRTVRATVGQLVEVPFRGAGWVFLGELSSRKGLPYDSRRLDADGQSFIFRAEAVGTYSLKFFRQDFIEDYVVNDYVRVVIGESAGGSTLGGFSVPVDRGRVVAEPRWPLTGAPVAASAPTAAPTAPAAPTAASAAAAPQTAPTMASPAAPASAAPGPATPVQAAPAQATTTPTPAAATTAMPAATMPAASTAVPAAATRAPASSAPQAASTPTAMPATGAATSPTAAAGAVATGPQGLAAIEALPSDAGPEAFLAIVKTEAEAGRTASALEALDRFRDRFPAGTDEAWWLYGRLLETNGPTKDVKAALGFYKRLVADYPQSSRYDEARKRIAYLERYYFQIR
jgi:hypothetical protein